MPAIRCSSCNAVLARTLVTDRSTDLHVMGDQVTCWRCRSTWQDPGTPSG